MIFFFFFFERERTAKILVTLFPQVRSCREYFKIKPSLRYQNVQESFAVSQKFLLIFFFSLDFTAAAFILKRSRYKMRWQTGDYKIVYSSKKNPQKRKSYIKYYYFKYSRIVSPYKFLARLPLILSLLYLSSIHSHKPKSNNIMLNSYHIYPTPPLGQDMTQGQFLSGVQQVWIQSFPYPRLVASPRLKNLVCPTIFP